MMILSGSCRDLARIYIRDGYTVLPVLWSKSPHPYLISKAQGSLKEVVAFYRGGRTPILTGRYTTSPFYELGKIYSMQHFEQLFPAERVDVLWAEQGYVKRIVGYGVAICVSELSEYVIIDVDAPLYHDAAEKLAYELNTFTVSTPHEGIHIYLRSYDNKGRVLNIGKFKVEVKGVRSYCIAPPTRCFCERCRGRNRWVGFNYMPANQLPYLRSFHELQNLLGVS